MNHRDANNRPAGVGVVLHKNEKFDKMMNRFTKLTKLFPRKPKERKGRFEK